MVSCEQFEEKLTTREIEVVSLISKGLSNKAIGRLLDLTEATVKVHLKNIYARLNIRNRTALAVWACSKPVIRRHLSVDAIDEKRFRPRRRVKREKSPPPIRRPTAGSG
jgi:DNA-binding CsgD family transcriptional regulator